MVWRLHTHVRYRLAAPYAVQGFGAYGSQVDQVVERGPDDWPLIPASSWRGRVRAHLESLLRGLGVPVCHPPKPSSTCPHDGPVLRRLRRHGRWFCPVCELFGSPWRPARLRFSDLTHPHRRDDPAPVAERFNVTVSRLSGSVEEQRLFSYETAGGGQEAGWLLEGTVLGDVEPGQAGLVLAALRLPTHLGGKKARGLGFIEEVTFPVLQFGTGNGSPTPAGADQVEAWIDKALEEVSHLADSRSL